MLKTPTDEPAAVLREALVGKYPELKLVAEIPRTPQTMLVRTHMQKNVQREYPPPDMQSLQYNGHGISQEQSRALQKTDEALILEFTHPKQHAWAALHTATALGGPGDKRNIFSRRLAQEAVGILAYRCA